MARTRYRIFENEQEYPYFMTCTVVGWVPVFTRPQTVQFVLDSWRHLREHNQFQLLGYVILENHLHLIARSPELSRAMQSFKSYTARQILVYLEDQKARTLLDQFARLRLSHKKDSHYQFWQEGSKPKQIRTDDVMWQKLEYVHFNPVNRGYIDDPVHWRVLERPQLRGTAGVD